MTEEILIQALSVQDDAFRALYEAFDSVAKAYYRDLNDAEGRSRLLSLMLHMEQLKTRVTTIGELAATKEAQ